MPIAAPIQNSFNSGEFSPVFIGRSDYQKYKSGTTLMQRFLPMVQGGATRCPGFKYINQTKANGQVRLVPFVFSNGDAFVIEFGDLYCRFFRNRLPVLAATQPITSITQASQGVVTYSGADTFANGDEVFIDNSIVGMTALNNTWVVVDSVNVGAKTFKIKDRYGNYISTSGFGAYVSGGTLGEVYQIVSPYPLADVDDIRTIQSSDVVYIAHPSVIPQTLSRTAVNAWAFAAAVFSDGPYLPINAGTTTLTPAATTGNNILVTASSIVGINGGQGFLSTDVNRFIRIKHATTWGWAIIKTYNSTTTVHVDIQSAFGNTTASAVWRTGEWSDTTGYPSVIFSFEDRLGWAASPVSPTTLNMSTTSDYLNMAPTNTDSTVVATNALQLRLNSRQQDPIRWVSEAEQGLLIGTKGAEWVVRSNVSGDAMSAINFPSAKRSTNYGSAFVEILEIAKAAIFVQTSKRKVREQAYVLNVDGFKAPDMTLLAEHMTESGVKHMVFQQEPLSIIWVARLDGSLVAMTYDRDQDVVGWHRHPVGGVSDANGSPAIIESVAVIPSPDGTQDDLWVSSKRRINGGTRRFIEVLSPLSTNYTDITACFFVDAGVTVNLGSPGTAITGLGHLEGESVQILADGSPMPNQIVVGGNITAPKAATIFQIGEGYLSRLQTLRPEAGSATGTAQGKIKRLHRVAALLHQTVGLRVGRDFVTMDAQQFRTASDLMDVAVPLFSGIKPLEFPSDYDTDGYVCLEQAQPLPCTILALMPQLHTQDNQ